MLLQLIHELSMRGEKKTRLSIQNCFRSWRIWPSINLGENAAGADDFASLIWRFRCDQLEIDHFYRPQKPLTHPLNQFQPFYQHNK